MPASKPSPRNEAAPGGLHVVILAAGEGKRMRSDLPKVLQKVAGRPMLSHVMAAARELSPAAIHVVHGHGGERVRETYSHRSDLQWVEQGERLGTGHAVREAMPGVPDGAQVLVLYGDVPLITARTLRRLLTAGGRLAVLVARLEDPAGYGRIVRDSEGNVGAIVEEKDATAEQRRIDIVNTGVLVAESTALKGWLQRLSNDNAQGEYYLTDIFAMAAQEYSAAEMVLVHDPVETEGANDPWQLAQLERALQLRLARDLCAQGVRFADPARVDIRGHVVAGRDVEIDVDVVLEGRVVLGDGVRVGPFCRIRDAELGEGTVVRAHCDIEGATVGRRATVGPFARLRPGTALADAVHVGNFVETKNSALGEGSKANHLSYLGDAVVGAGANIGAGTITCNYDGANKSTTTIGDGAFIGSNSSLVAPVEIGRNATIGAGSVITSNAPPTSSRMPAMPLSESSAGAAFGLRTFPYAVFLDADRVNFQKEGFTSTQMLAGLAQVLPKNVWQYVVQIPRLASLGRKFVLQGGTQYNLAAVKAQVERFIADMDLVKREDYDALRELVSIQGEELAAMRKELDALTEDPAGWARRVVMPALTIGLVAGSILTRYIRSSVLEVLVADHVRTARSKGLRSRVVIGRHVVRNALIPVLTITGNQLATMLGGVVVVEVVFAWPGLGRLIYDAVLARDYPLLQGAILLVAAIFLLINLLVDLLYGKVDPRIRVTS